MRPTASPAAMDTLFLEGEPKISYDEAMAAYQQSLDLDPYFYKGYTAVGRVYFLKGMYDLAIELFLKGRSLAGEIPNIIGALGQTYGMLGRTREARQALEDLTCLAERAYVPSTCFAVIHLGLGEKERALEWLETGCNLRELPMSTLKIQPVYDPLRGDPRFECLIKRMRLAD
jgi:serine/threonine-protein kinase